MVQNQRNIRTPLAVIVIHVHRGNPGMFAASLEARDGVRELAGASDQFLIVWKIQIVMTSTRIRTALERSGAFPSRLDLLLG